MFLKNTNRKSSSYEKIRFWIWLLIKNLFWEINKMRIFYFFYSNVPFPIFIVTLKFILQLCSIQNSSQFQWPVGQFSTNSLKTGRFYLKKPRQQYPSSFLFNKLYSNQNLVDCSIRHNPSIRVPSMHINIKRSRDSRRSSSDVISRTVSSKYSGPADMYSASIRGVYQSENRGWHNGYTEYDGKYATEWLVGFFGIRSNQNNRETPGKISCCFETYNIFFQKAYLTNTVLRSSDRSLTNSDNSILGLTSEIQ